MLIPMYDSRKNTHNQLLIALSLLNKIFLLACGFIHPIVEEITKLLRIK